MFGRMFWNEATQRTKNGQPDQSTTGVASASSAQRATSSPIHCPTGRPSIGPIASSITGTIRIAPTINRCVKSTSSGSGPDGAADGLIGSSAMPQIGQVPGPSCTISGSIGQV